MPSHYDDKMMEDAPMKEGGEEKALEEMLGEEAEAIDIGSEWSSMDDQAKQEAAQVAGIPVENLDRIIAEAAKVPQYQAMSVMEFAEAISTNPDMIIQLQRTEEAPAPKTRGEMKEADDGMVL